MSFLDTNYIINVILNFLIILLLIAIYTYIVNLENKGCECAQSKDSIFIKNFSIFAIVYYIVMMFIPQKLIYKNLGVTAVYLFGIINIIFITVCIYFWFCTFRYTRHLVNEKCKCSEDMRREIIMIGSIIELFLIFFIFIAGLIIAISVSILSTTFSYIKNNETNLGEVLKNPAKSFNKLPSKFKNDISSVGKLVKGTSSNLKKLIKANSKKR